MSESVVKRPDGLLFQVDLGADPFTVLSEIRVLHVRPEEVSPEHFAEHEKFYEMYRLLRELLPADSKRSLLNDLEDCVIRMGAHRATDAYRRGLKDGMAMARAIGLAG
ncbi:MAG: hypothetical protein U1D96_03445 [Eubacteriales bacterium]|nr:hypothetical protein [Eubacteriales bacterium]